MNSDDPEGTSQPTSAPAQGGRPWSQATQEDSSDTDRGSESEQPMKANRDQPPSTASAASTGWSSQMKSEPGRCGWRRRWYSCC